VGTPGPQPGAGRLSGPGPAIKADWLAERLREAAVVEVNSPARAMDIAKARMAVFMRNGS